MAGAGEQYSLVTNSDEGDGELLRLRCEQPSPPTPRSRRFSKEITRGFTCGWLLRGYLLLVLLPVPVMLLPIVLPFQHVEPNHRPDVLALVRLRCVFFFWYCPLGWGILFTSMSLWTSTSLRMDGATPWTVAGFCCCSLLPTLFCTGLYIAGSTWIFPFPLATLCMGVPSFFFWCVCIFARIPRTWWEQPGHGWRFFGIVCFWTLWFVSLSVLALLTHFSFRTDIGGGLILAGGVIGLKALTHHVSGQFLSSIVETGRLTRGADGEVVIRGHSPAPRLPAQHSPEITPASTRLPSVSSQAPLQGNSDFSGVNSYVMQGVSRDECFEDEEPVSAVVPLLFIWLDYTLTIYQNFIFPVGLRWRMVLLIIASSIVNECRQVSLMSAASCMEQNTSALAQGRHVWYQRLWKWTVLDLKKMPKAAVQLELFVFRQMGECLAPLHFMAIFAFDAFLWNKQEMYQIDQVTRTKACEAVVLLGFAAALQTCCTCLHLRNLLSGHLETVDETFLRHLIVQSCTTWAVPLVLAFGSVSTVAGACMIMKHDGMDLSFKFDWIQPDDAIRRDFHFGWIQRGR